MILLLAFVLRMGWPSWVEFKRDEATVVRRAAAIAYEGDLPIEGVDSSAGPANLPLTLYVMAAPLRLWADPLAVVLCTTFLNALAVLACYFVGQVYLGPRAAFTAAFLFALNPWAILYARKIWCHPLPLFTLTLIASLLAAFVSRKPWALVGVWASLAIQLGLQLEALALVPLLALLLIYHRDVAWKPLLAGCAVFGVSMAPYVLYDAFHGWQNARGFLAYAAEKGRFTWDALRYPLMLTGSAGIEGQAGGLAPEFLRAVPNLWWLNTLTMGVFLLALAYAVHQAFFAPDARRRRVFVILLVWFAAPIALQLRPAHGTHLHYFVTQYPVQFFLIGAGLDALLNRFAAPVIRVGKLSASLPGLGVLGGLLVWGMWQGLVTYRLRTYMTTHPTTGGYGIPLAYTRPAAQAARQLAGDAEIIVVGTGNRPFITETPTVFDALLFDHPHRFTDGRRALPIPESTEGVYLVGPMQDTPDDPLWPMIARLSALPSVEAGPSVTLPDGWMYRTFLRRGADRGDVLTGMMPLAAGIPLANKVVFAAAELPQTATPGASLEVWLTWWLQGPPPAADYHLTVQLLDAAGGLAAQDDHAAFPADTWRVGDLVLNRLALPLPETLAEGEYTVRAGMYTYPDITGVPVVDASGNPIDDGVMLGTVVLQNP